MMDNELDLRNKGRPVLNQINEAEPFRIFILINLEPLPISHNSSKSLYPKLTLISFPDFKQIHGIHFMENWLKASRRAENISKGCSSPSTSKIPLILVQWRWDLDYQGPNDCSKADKHNIGDIKSGRPKYWVGGPKIKGALKRNPGAF
ncbi:hypothetical protein CEXT_542941 [Caerostris extrusa]|uniref:Uncharacterized protein n=1 Tax=Caerostris extrusa TaxID=172846 RepID=A0AAV4NPG3_CAEEX|nr:hypothetical protein CEXT_542941 [Caerostris extrusa]